MNNAAVHPFLSLIAHVLQSVVEAMKTLEVFRASLLSISNVPVDVHQCVGRISSYLIGLLSSSNVRAPELECQQQHQLEKRSRDEPSHKNRSDVADQLVNVSLGQVDQPIHLNMVRNKIVFCVIDINML